MPLSCVLSVGHVVQHTGDWAVPTTGDQAGYDTQKREQTPERHKCCGLGTLRSLGQ